MSQLDKNKPFGETWGFADHRYVQDGKKFDAAGNEVTDKNAKAPRPQSTASKAVATVAAAAPAADQLDAQLKG